MKRKREQTDVGVIVGRFHVDDLHEAHTDLIQSVINENVKVIIFLGLAPTKVTINNPLDFESRKQMLLEAFPDVNVLYIKDMRDDDAWSRKLDDQIADLTGPASTVTLYGSRESFIDHYTTNKYRTCVMEQEIFVSGTEIRKKIGKKVKADSKFRRGVIWAVYNQYPKVYPTVDIAIWNEDYTKLLLGRKREETQFRFIGGFVGPKESYEQAARREANEETHLEISNPVYIDSFEVDDWRYRREQDTITTAFFEAKRIFGKPTPDDDIEELRWFDFADLELEDVVEEHIPLLKALRAKDNKVKKRHDQPMVGVGVFVVKDGQILLGQRKGSHGAGLYSLPGGHLEKNETFEKCAAREAMEEAGIEIDNIHTLTAINDLFPRDGLHYATIFMIADYKKGKVTNMEPEKCTGWNWYDPNELPQPMTETVVKALKWMYDNTNIAFIKD